MVSIFSSNENATLERSIDTKDEKSCEMLWENAAIKIKVLQQIFDWIEKNNYKNVCLQFSDALLCHSTEIVLEIQSRFNDCDVYVLADTSYGSCCVDEVAASHINADSLIHFGHACLSKITRLPVLYIFSRFPIDCDRFSNEFLQKFENKSIRLGIFYSVGYAYATDCLKKICSSYTNITFGELAIDTQPDILYWKIGNIQPEETICIYIGNEDQTFFNLSMSIEAKQWFLYNPSCESTAKFYEINPMKNWITKRSYHIELCKDAKSIGIVIGTLSTKGYLELVKHIQKLTKLRGIRSYVISVGKINPCKIDNFNDIDCFVLIGCAENNLYKSRDFRKRLVTAFEVEIALNPVWQSKFPESYCVDFTELLPNGKFYNEIERKQFEELQTDVSLLSGYLRNNGIINDDYMEADDNANSDLAIMERKNLQLLNLRSNDSFQKRSFTGLDPALGKNEPAKITQGQSGIAIKYTNDKNIETS